MSEPTALYRFYNHEDRLLYVGITRYVQVRWATHRRTKSWWYEVVRREVEWFETRELALEMETKAIIAERPVYNIAHARDRVFLKRTRPKGWNIAANPPAKPLYEAIVEELAARGQTKTWLTRHSGVSRSGIDNLAKQPRPPQAGTVIALAKTLGLDRDKALDQAGIRAHRVPIRDKGGADLSGIPTDVLMEELRRRINRVKEISKEIARRAGD